jgi:hypothetical protein
MVGAKDMAGQNAVEFIFTAIHPGVIPVDVTLQVRELKKSVNHSGASTRILKLSKQAVIGCFMRPRSSPNL